MDHYMTKLPQRSTKALSHPQSKKVKKNRSAEPPAVVAEQKWKSQFSKSGSVIPLGMTLKIVLFDNTLGKHFKLTY